MRSNRCARLKALGYRYEDGLVGRDLVLKAQADWHLIRRFNPFGHRPAAACMTRTDAGKVYLVTADEQHWSARRRTPTPLNQPTGWRRTSTPTIGVDHDGPVQNDPGRTRHSGGH